jgi:N-acetylglucosaminyldiphosphoundecaprenol N-acetyl-beta-D-mannosaminyltransferase
VQPTGQVNVLGVRVHAVDMQSTALLLEALIRGGGKGYVCLTGVHGIMEAQRDPVLKTIFTKALLVAPDGMPTVWMGHLQGFRGMQRVFGPDLMVCIMGRPEFRDCVHFFCVEGKPVLLKSYVTECYNDFRGSRLQGPSRHHLDR